MAVSADAPQDVAQSEARDQENLAYARRMLRATNCLPNSDRSSKPSDTDDRRETSRGTTRSRLSGMQILSENMSFVALVILGLAATAAAGLVISRSWLFRVGQVRRLPRHPVNIPARAETKSGTITDTTILDISTGGAKLRWDAALEERSTLIVHAGELRLQAQVMWSNAHFMGVMFDVPLDAATFAGLQGMDNSRKASSQAKSGV